MSSLFEALTEQLGGRAANEISQRIGADPSKTRDALPAALGSLMAALANNTTKSGGAEALDRALAKDHDGSILDNLDGYLADPQGGSGILKHALGGKRPAVEAGISQTTGLDQSSASELLKVLAPVVLGALGKARRRGDLDAGSLAGILASERRRVNEAAPKGFDLIGSLMDADGDGQVLDDIASKVGGGLLKSFLKG